MAVYFLIVDTGLPIAFKGWHTSPCNWSPEELNAGTHPKNSNCFEFKGAKLVPASRF